jgi:hypothetical protein
MVTSINPTTVMHDTLANITVLPALSCGGIEAPRRDGGSVWTEFSPVCRLQGRSTKKNDSETIVCMLVAAFRVMRSAHASDRCHARNVISARSVDACGANVEKKHKGRVLLRQLRTNVWPITSRRPSTLLNFWVRAGFALRPRPSASLRSSL